MIKFNLKWGIKIKEEEEEEKHTIETIVLKENSMTMMSYWPWNQHMME